MRGNLWGLLTILLMLAELGHAVTSDFAHDPLTFALLALAFVSLAVYLARSGVLKT